MKMQITLRSGAQIEVDVTEFGTKKNLAGDLVELNWTTPADPQAKLHMVRLDEVAAIVAMHPNSGDQR